MNFVAIDFETANPDFSSICQIGLVEFQNGLVVNTWETLVNPEDWFSDANISVHGIEEDSVADAPTWPTAYQRLATLLSGRIVVHHTAFDRTAMIRACDKYALPHPACHYLDSARVTRRTWTEFSRAGYGLQNLAQHFKIDFKHHNAMEDARAAGIVMLHALQHSGKPIEEWCVLSLEKLTLSGNPAETPKVNPNGNLYGECLVFTGGLVVPRSKATAMAADAGCLVAAGVTKHTTLLVVGDQDIRKLIGHEKSSKHRKAEELILQGKPIRIVGETDFFRLIA